MTQYQQLLIEIESWLQSTREILLLEPKNETELQIETNIGDYNKLQEELRQNEAKLRELSNICEEFKNQTDLQELATTLVEQLNTVTLLLIESKSEIEARLFKLHERLEELQKTPDASLENTLDSSSMPIEELPIHTDVKKETQEFIAAEIPSGVTIETQTGRSLSSPVPVTTKDVSVTCAPPTDVEIQTHLSESEEQPAKESITILKTIKDGQETIQIATKSETQPIIEEPDDLIVQADYRSIPEMSEEAVLNILHSKPNQPFETVLVEPDETTTEVIVDADGTKRIIVKRLQRTVVRQQQTLQQQQLKTTNILSEDGVPVSESFSQVTLQGQQSSTTLARGDGHKEILTTQSYGGKVISGAPGTAVTVHEFQSEPETSHKIIQGSELPEVEMQGIKLHQGDVTFVDDKNMVLVPADQNNEVMTSSSSVRAVVQQVTRRVIRRTRRIIRRIVIVDGKEQVTEEIVEEPEEVEFTEEGIPRVSINVTRTEDGKVVQEQQFGEPLSFPKPEVQVTRTVTSVVLDEQGNPIEEPRYVVEQATAQSDDTTAPLVTEPVEIVSEPSTEITAAEFIEREKSAQSIIVDASKIENAPKLEDACTLIEKARGDESVTRKEEQSIGHIEEVTIVPEVRDNKQTQDTSSSPDINHTLITDFIASEQNFHLPEVTQPDKIEASSPSTEHSSSKSKSKKKRKLKSKTQPIGTPRAQSPGLPTEEEEVMKVKDELTDQSKITPTEYTLSEVLDLQNDQVKHEPLSSQQDFETTGKQSITTTIETIEKEDKDSKTLNVEDSKSQEIQFENISVEIPASPTVQTVFTPQASADVQLHEAPQEQPEIESNRSEHIEITKETNVTTTDVDDNGIIKEVQISSQMKQIEKPSVHTVEFELSLEEKRPHFTDQITPKLEISVKAEDSEGLSKDVHATLPSFTEEKVETIVKTVALTPIVPKTESEHDESSTPSDIDHGGRKSKKKKKKESKTPSEKSETVEEKTPSGKSEIADEVVPLEDTKVSLDTTLADSTEIDISDSHISEDTPKPTEDVFEVEPSTETTQTEGESAGGYEADKATVDESVVEEDRDVEKKKRKKKRKQKIKQPETEESHVPMSTTDVSPLGESAQFSDEDNIQHRAPEETKKTRKRKKDRKGHEIEIQEIESRAEESESPVVLEAHSDVLVSPADSYKTLSSQSEPGTVKIVEETIITADSESPQDIASKLVTTVPVVEAVITQEALAQTSPEVSEITDQFIKQESAQAIPVTTDEVYSQTSPILPPDVNETSVQTTEVVSLEPEVTDVTQEAKPELIESSSQVEIETVESLTQTSIPENLEALETLETALKTATPEKAEVVETVTQTSTPEYVQKIETTETVTQTSTPENVEKLETAENPTQTSTPEYADKVEIAETVTQTSTPEHAPKIETVETVTQTSAPGTPVIPSSQEVTLEKVEAFEVVTQTSTPEKESLITTEISVQTATPEKVETLEESVQTLTPEVAETQRNESAMQTIVVESQEEYAQTSTPEVQQIATQESETQAKPYDIVPPLEQSIQTSPVPSAPPLEDEFVQTSPLLAYPEQVTKATVETIETTSQTQPVVVHSLDELTPPTSSSEQYEVQIQASVTVPPDVEVVQHIEPTVNNSVKVDTIDTIFQQSLPENVQVSVTVDGLPVNKNEVVTSFLDAERKSVTSGGEDKPEKPKRAKKRKNQPDKPIEKGLFEQFTKQNEPTATDSKDLYSQVAKSDTENFKTSKELPANVISQPEEVQWTVTEKTNETPTIAIPPSAEKVVSTFETQTKIIENLPTQQTLEKSEAVLQVPTEIVEKPADVIDSKTSISTAIVEFPPEVDDHASSTMVNISVTIPRETESSLDDSEKSPLSIEPSPPPSLTSELTIDTSVESILQPKSLPKSKKSKSKSKSVPIEEVLSPTEVADTPITPSADAPLSPPDYSKTSYVWEKPSVSKDSPREDKPIQAAPLLDIGIRWNQTQALERVKNLQNANRTMHLSDVLYLATLNEVVTDESIEERNYNVQQQINALREAVVKKDVEVIQQSVITTVQTITTWLETIEYRIYLNRQQTADGPSKERVQELNNLKDEIVNIENKVENLQSALNEAGDIYNEDDRERMKNYIDSLQRQVKVIESVTEENEQLAAADLSRWEDFVKGVSIVSKQINDTKKRLDELNDSDASPQSKLNDLENLESINRANMVETTNLITMAKGLMRDFPGREIPQEVFVNHDLTKQLEHSISVEREKVLQLLSLADEYEQTLKDFSQIIDIADVLVESPISVRNLEHLEEEMQNHRKFFVNLSHCRAILESLEENLDSETRALHSDLHQNLYERARVSLDKATGRFQQMSLAASRWTVLEQGTKDEIRWLQVAQQRVPDLSSVTSADYDQYINLYQSLSLDIAHHHAKLSHLNGVAQKLQELVICSELEETYIESLEIIKKLQDDVQNNLKKLIAFRDLWGTYNLYSDKLEMWLKDAEHELQTIGTPEGEKVPLPGHMRQFWVSYRTVNIEPHLMLILFLNILGVEGSTRSTQQRSTQCSKYFRTFYASYAGSR